MKKNFNILLLLSILGVGAFFVWKHCTKIEHIALPTQAYAWVNTYQFYAIAHGMGAAHAEEKNRIATFYKSYADGFRFFEVDLMMTQDNHLICYHGAQYDENITYQHYVDDSLAMKQAPCGMDDLIQLAKSHPDVYFVLDLKNEQKFEQAYQMIKAKVAQAKVGYSFIPQIYYIEQSAFIRAGQIFSAEIFTGYRVSYSTKKIFKQAREAQIPVVTIPKEWVERAPLAHDLLIFIHPVNDIAEVIAFRQQGVSGIFTSILSPKNAPNLYVDNRKRIS
ncbi:MAG: glycerophosphodiester phosphodiesterase family protein [Legionellales bacterium]|jgi:glycerophosphoryl diester phosphodiesterase